MLLCPPPPPHSPDTSALCHATHGAESCVTENREARTGLPSQGRRLVGFGDEELTWNSQNDQLPIGLRGSVGRVLHRYRKVHELEFHLGFDFVFQASQVVYIMRYLHVFSHFKYDLSCIHSWVLNTDVINMHTRGSIFDNGTLITRTSGNPKSPHFARTCWLLR